MYNNHCGQINVASSYKVPNSNSHYHFQADTFLQSTGSVTGRTTFFLALSAALKEPFQMQSLTCTSFA